MDPVDALRRLGGLADRPALLRLTSRRRLRTAVSRGRVVRVARDRYVLPQLARGELVAARLGGYVSHVTAALHWGWEVKEPPELPDVTVRRGRNLSLEQQAVARVHWKSVSDEELTGLVTSPLRTVLDCAVALPFDEALAVADSALRHRDVSPAELRRAADLLEGRGSRKARRVAAAADARARNPFESVLRALALEAGLEVTPQYPLQFADRTLHPDLADPGRRLLLEANSFEFHGRRADDHASDCARYNAFVIAGWRVLRFTWEQVMLSPGYVLDVLHAVQGPPKRPNTVPAARDAA